MATSDEATIAAWALPLHQAIRDRVHQGADALERLESDIALAEHLVFSGERARAASLLEPLLDGLPRADLIEVLPPEGADLTRGEGGDATRLRVLELLVAARGDEAADPGTLAALARNQPLVPHRLESLAQADAGGRQARAAVAARCLRPGGLCLHSGGLSESPQLEDARIRALPDEQIPHLHHPIAQGGGTMGKLQAALARVSPPDHGVLRDYCERISTRHGEAPRVIAEASRLLGMDPVPAFVSRGERRVGLRSHEEPSPFMLIGGAHLDPDSPHHFSPGELRFAVGAEIAHIKFQHSRVTSSDVWGGIWDKGTMALGAAATLLPFLRYVPIDLVGRERTARAVGVLIPNAWLKKIYDAEAGAALASQLGGDLGKLGNAGASVADSASGALDKVKTAADKLLPDGIGPAAPETDVGLEVRHWVAAHRVMQLSADRTGLVLCGDLRAALRAIFLQHSRLLPQLERAETEGLHAILGTHTEDGALAFPELATRVAGLVAFWLSDEYAALRQAAVADPAESAPAESIPAVSTSEAPAG